MNYKRIPYLVLVIAVIASYMAAGILSEPSTRLGDELFFGITAILSMQALTTLKED